jgi:soluble lytic murein transglycosylase-like protein
MPPPSLIALLFLAALLPATGAVAADPASACLEAASAAERNWTLPPDLIHAIGRVESGRYDRATNRVSPWPWTVNANGTGFVFDSQLEAVTFVRILQSRGVRLIDVGCFQVDLFYHPSAFSSLEQAFDPAANADYAARFLSQLRGRTGSWPAAIAGYHSAVAQEGETYRQKVMTRWNLGGLRADASYTPPRVIPDRQSNTDPHVVMMSPAARAIHVYYSR